MSEITENSLAAERELQIEQLLSEISLLRIESQSKSNTSPNIKVIDTEQL